MTSTAGQLSFDQGERHLLPRRSPHLHLLLLLLLLMMLTLLLLHDAGKATTSLLLSPLDDH